MVNPILSASLRYREKAISQENSNICKQLYYNCTDFNNDLFDLKIGYKNTPNKIGVNIKAIIKKNIALELFTVHFRIPKDDKISCIGRSYTICEIKKSIWNNDLTPLYVEYVYDGTHWRLTTTTKLFSYKIINNKEYFELVIFIDAAALHPGWSHEFGERISTASPIISIGDEYNVHFDALRIVDDNVLPILYRYPTGAEAVYILTDHCDYDTAEKLNVFNKGWINKNLKITKGVFTLPSTGKNAKKASTIEDKQYKTLIDNLYNDGSEIVPHALNQSGQIRSEQFETALDLISDIYKPQTWIDHGSYLDYCYSVGGGKHKEFKLTDNLKKRNFSAIWSYYDIAASPYRSLNLFFNDKNNLSASINIIAKSLAKGQILIAAHQLKSILERNDSGSKRRKIFLKLVYAFRLMVMRNKTNTIRSLLVDAFTQSKATYLPYSIDEIKNCAPCLYVASSKPLSQLQSDDMIMFAAQEVVHIDQSYKPSLLKDLVNKKGLHIGHTYILNELPYINGIFLKRNKYVLAPYWINFVYKLSEKVLEGTIWNPNMGEFVSFIKQLFLIELDYCTDNKLVINNKGKSDVEGLTLFLKRGVAYNNVRWNNELPQFKIDASNNILFWGNVPALSSVIVEW